jgi:hypothetical protein
MKIFPHIGIEEIQFGMTMENVRSIWGQPANIRYFIPIEENPEERDIIWEYDEGIELSFSSDYSFLLSTIESSSQKDKLNGVVMVGRKLSELILVFPKLFLEQDFEENGRNYELPDLDISLWVKGDVVETVFFFPEHEKNGTTIIWPDR